MCIEGIEGSGKSTLLSGLLGRLESAGVATVATREPGGTVLGNRLRATFVEPGLRIDPLAEAFIVNASRAQHVTEVIEPALASGRWVLCDRFSTATLAYQGYGRGIDIATLLLLAKVATRGRAPDLTLLLDLEVDRSRERVLARAMASGEAVDRLEREDAAFHALVRSGYLELARHDPSFVILDARLPQAELLGAAWRELQAKYGV